VTNVTCSGATYHYERPSPHQNKQNGLYLMTSKRQLSKRMLVRRPPNFTLRLQQSWRREGEQQTKDEKKLPPKAA